MPTKKTATEPDPTPQSSDAAEPDALAALDQLSYEDAREQLIGVVQQLESGGTPLAESLALWERGEKLATVCQRWLDGAKAKIAAATEQADEA